MYDIKVESAYQWKPILIEEDKEYRFPEKITSFMRKTYKHPAIYRWNIFTKELGDEKLIYIGEAQELCPQQWCHEGQRPFKEKYARVRDVGSAC